MTVSSIDAREVYTGAGTVGPFDIPFYFLVNGDIKLVKTLIASPYTETPLAITADYTLTGAGTNNPPTGQATLVVALPATHKLTIYRDPDGLQQADFDSNNDFPAEANERALDKLTMLYQRFLDLFTGRTMRLSDGDVSGVNMTLPSPVAGALLAVNAARTAFEWVVSTGTVLAVSAFGIAWVAAVNVAAAMNLLGITAAWQTIITAFSFNAKGDTMVATGAGVVARLPVGTNGQVPVADSTQATGWNWTSFMDSLGRTDIAVSATPAIFAATTPVIHLTGTGGPITGFDSPAGTEGKKRLVKFDATGAMMTYHATQLILPIPFDIQVMVGDSMLVESLAGGNSKVHFYQRANGQVLLGGRIPFGSINFGVVNAAASTTVYLYRGVGQGSAGGTEALGTYVASEALTISELRGVASAALAGGTAAFTLRKNGADTAVTATLGIAAGTAFSDTTHSVDYSEGDLISLKLITGAIGAVTDFGVSFKVTKKGANVGVPTQFWQMLGSNSMGTVGVGVAHTYGMASAQPSLEFLTGPCRIATKAPYYAQFAAAGTLTGPTVYRAGVNPSGIVGTANAPQVYVPAASQMFGCGVRGPVISFAEGDYYLAWNQSGTDSDAAYVRWSYDCLGPTDFQYPPSLLNFQCGQQAQALTRYAGAFSCNGGGGMGLFQSATETDCQVPMPACTLRNLRVMAGTVVAAGQNTVVTIRKNGVDTGLTCTLVNASRIITDLVNSVVFVAGDILSVKVVSSATAGTHDYQITVEMNPL